MARPPDAARRNELVSATLDDLAATGLAEFTLRGLADRLGISARMLVHYFGGREQLLTAVFAEHRRRMLAVITATAAASPGPSEAATAAWSAMTAETQRAHFTVMYQVLTASLTPRSGELDTARAAITAWVDYATEVLATTGADPGATRATATALTSGLKGILLDRLVTGDHQRCDDAAKTLITALLGPARTD